MSRVITYDPESNEYDVPLGVHLCRFVGVKDKEPFKESAYGNDGEPRYGWRFEVIGPPGNPAMGKIIEQNTGTRPTARSGLVRLLNMMLAGQGGLQPKQSVNPDSLIARIYNVRWEVNPESKKGNPWIAFLNEVGADAATTPPPRTITNPHAPPVPAAMKPLASDPLTLVAPGFEAQAEAMPPRLDPRLPVPPAPPPRRGAQTAPRGTQGPPQPQRYFVNNGQQPPPLATLKEIQDHINGHGLKASDLDICAEGTAEWKPAETFGLVNAEIPY